MNIGSCILFHVDRIKKRAPVIHNITNFVVMTSSANILLALGASPVMAHCRSEIKEMVSISNALVLNIGTLDEDWIETMVAAATAANNLKIPVILDAVGAGATQLRTKAAHKISNECKLSVLRGNASEILALTSANVRTRGVDSAVKETDDVIEAAKKIALAKHCVVAVSGVKDIITNGISTNHIANGHEIMTKVTGMGCGLTAFTGAFCAVASNNDYLAATEAAFALYGACGDVAAKNCGTKPGSFFTKFLDTIYTIDPQNLPVPIRSESR